MPASIDYLQPVPSPREDLPEGVAAFAATSHSTVAEELIREAAQHASVASAYRDHVVALSLANESVSYAEAARLIGVARQTVHERFSPCVTAFLAECETATMPWEKGTDRA